MRDTANLLLTLPSLATIVSVSRSAHGLGGVLFLEFATGEHAVAKALTDDLEAGSVRFCRDLCLRAGIAHPDIAVIDTVEGAGAELAARARQLANDSELVGPSLEELRRCVQNIFDRRRVLIMEYVRGVDALPKDAPDVCEQRLKERATDVGRVMAVDLILNNWDRVGNAALRSWVPDPNAFFAPTDGPGNLDNLMLGDDGSTLWAIDTDLKRGFAPMREATDSSYLEEVRALMADLHESQRRGGLSTIVHEAMRCFRLKRGVQSLGDAVGAQLQAGLVGTLSTLARPEQQIGELLRAALVDEAATDSLDATAEGLVARTHGVLEMWRTAGGGGGGEEANVAAATAATGSCSSAM